MVGTVWGEKGEEKGRGDNDVTMWIHDAKHIEFRSDSVMIDEMLF